MEGNQHVGIDQESVLCGCMVTIPQQNLSTGLLGTITIFSNEITLSSFTIEMTQLCSCGDPNALSFVFQSADEQNFSIAGTLSTIISSCTEGVRGTGSGTFYWGRLPIGVSLTLELDITNAILKLDLSTANNVNFLSIELSSISGIVATPIPTVYVTNSGSSSVSVINSATNSVSNTIAVGRDPRGICITLNQTAYVANSDNNNVSVIDTTSNKVVETIRVGVEPLGVGCTDDGKYVYVANFGESTVSVIDTSSNTVIQTITVKNAYGVAVDASGNAYVTSNPGTTVTVIDPSFAVKQTITVESGPTSVAINPSNSNAYVTNSASNTVSVISLANYSVISTLSFFDQNEPVDVAFTSDGKSAYVTTLISNLANNAVYVVDTGSLALLTTIPLATSTPSKNASGCAITIPFIPICGVEYAYVTDCKSIVYVISTVSNSVQATIDVGVQPFGIASQ